MLDYMIRKYLIILSINFLIGEQNSKTFSHLSFKVRMHISCDMFTFSVTSKVFLKEFLNFYEMFVFNSKFYSKYGVMACLFQWSFYLWVCVLQKVFVILGKFVVLKGYNQI